MNISNHNSICLCSHRANQLLNIRTSANLSQPHGFGCWWVKGKQSLRQWLMRQGVQGKWKQCQWGQGCECALENPVPLQLPGSLLNNCSKFLPLGQSNIHGAKLEQELKQVCPKWLGPGFTDILVSQLGCCDVWSEWGKRLVPSPSVSFHLFNLNQSKL